MRIGEQAKSVLSRRARSAGLVLIHLMQPVLTPELGSDGKRVNLPFLPPSPLITGCVIFTVMDGTKGYCEFIAYFECQTSRLGKTDVMCVGRSSAADDARLAATKRRCFFERTRFGSAMASTLLSTFGRVPVCCQRMRGWLRYLAWPMQSHVLSYARPEL